MDWWMMKWQNWFFFDTIKAIIYANFLNHGISDFCLPINDDDNDDEDDDDIFFGNSFGNNHFVLHLDWWFLSFSLAIFSVVVVVQ